MSLSIILFVSVSLSAYHCLSKPLCLVYLSPLTPTPSPLPVFLSSSLSVLIFVLSFSFLSAITKVISYHDLDRDIEVGTKCLQHRTIGEFCLLRAEGYMCDCADGLFCQSRNNETFGHCEVAIDNDVNDNKEKT